jgi:hypothetical protein
LSIVSFATGRQALEVDHPSQELALPRAPGVRKSDGLEQCRRASATSVIERESLQVAEIDERARDGLVREAVDRPADRRQVEQRLSGGCDAQAAIRGDVADAAVDPYLRIPSSPGRSHYLRDRANRDQFMGRSGAGVAQRRARSRGQECR